MVDNVSAKVPSGVAGFYSQDISVKVLNREVFDKQGASVFQACVSLWVPLVPLSSWYAQVCQHEPLKSLKKQGCPAIHTESQVEDGYPFLVQRAPHATRGIPTVLKLL